MEDREKLEIPTIEAIKVTLLTTQAGSTCNDPTVLNDVGKEWV